MLLALDVGNTNLTTGLVKDRDVVSSHHASTPSSPSAEQVASMIADLLGADSVSLDDVSEIVLASVVPAVTVAVREMADRRGTALVIADSSNVPIDVRVGQSTSVGTDRLINAYAASRLYGTPAIVVDMGTATTFDVVSADGAFIGGAIAPGIALGVRVLAEHTALLPRVPLALPAAAIGTDTVTAIQSGVVLGHIGLVQELVRAITKQLAVDGGERPMVVLTGGHSNGAWATAISGIDAIEPLLTLRGLALVHAEITRKALVARA